MLAVAERKLNASKKRREYTARQHRIVYTHYSILNIECIEYTYVITQTISGNTIYTVKKYEKHDLHYTCFGMTEREE